MRKKSRLVRLRIYVFIWKLIHSFFASAFNNFPRIEQKTIESVERKKKRERERNHI